MLLICFFKEESENQETVKEEIEETSMVEDRSEHKGSLFCIFFTIDVKLSIMIIIFGFNLHTFFNLTMI